MVGLYLNLSVELYEMEPERNYAMVLARHRIDLLVISDTNTLLNWTTLLFRYPGSDGKKHPAHRAVSGFIRKSRRNFSVRPPQVWT